MNTSMQAWKTVSSLQISSKQYTKPGLTNLPSNGSRGSCSNYHTPGISRFHERSEAQSSVETVRLSKGATDSGCYSRPQDFQGQGAKFTILDENVFS